ncbi:MAG: biotin/lipoyl-containing protein [Candidatus Limnocylindria bacterium]
MTDEEHAFEAIARAAAELVPALTERLSRHGLGEIEVTTEDLRVRVARAAAAPRPVDSLDATNVSITPAPGPSADPTVGVASPAVGFFVYADGLGPGLDVEKGDALGQVEMLGIRHDVRAPRSGTVRHLVAESGEAVEYGQVVLELEALETTS